MDINDIPTITLLNQIAGKETVRIGRGERDRRLELIDQLASEFDDKFSKDTSAGSFRRTFSELVRHSGGLVRAKARPEGSAKSSRIKRDLALLRKDTTTEGLDPDVVALGSRYAIAVAMVARVDNLLDGMDADYFLRRAGEHLGQRVEKEEHESPVAVADISPPAGDDTPAALPVEEIADTAVPADGDKAVPPPPAAVSVELKGKGIRARVIDALLARSPTERRSELDTFASEVKQGVLGKYKDRDAGRVNRVIGTMEQGGMKLLSAGQQPYARAMLQAATPARPELNRRMFVRGTSAEDVADILLREQIPDAPAAEQSRRGVF